MQRNKSVTHNQEKQQLVHTVPETVQALDLIHKVLKSAI